ncbi:DUF2756 family protein [Scandinavium sp. V105_16]|uniref:DUF2756 family protein n=1 Tax=Scandinavium lactucae TaxID=3095028 RepID=A0AAJ2S5P7_9ENTR|nr:MULTISPECIES: DUF2756 family protein [unclassified Scandinavium]MDX6019403.1 DUF2756 family protein [Scandinavium sp. V105_16]MDX6030441.1 DUF2756 family protein [Scandinavium sp. V105_12]MDX6039522.1 DUF2756 family protein [Scandinavium sp. V105_6]MDX6048984.1 DUF2756 family protein [Scandinavium sp. V105_1]
MKTLIFLTALVPFAVLAQPLNPTNNPNQPGYVIPSQQRMKTEMQTQQLQQKGMLNQQLQTQTQVQQQHLQTQMNNNQQRVLNGQPGEQVLPNAQGGMLSGGNSDKMLNSSSQHMLPQTQNGDLLSTPSNPQPLSR